MPTLDNILILGSNKFQLKDLRRSVDIPIAGIYKIVNSANGKFYLGSSKNLNERARQHLRKLRSGKHANRHLQNSFNKYEEQNFIFIVILICETFELRRYEQLLLTKLKPEYNVATVASGHDWTIESRKKMSEVKLGKKRKPFSPEWCKKLGKAWLGRKHSEETKIKIRNSRIGFKQGERAKTLISEKNSKTYHGFISPDGTVYRDITNIRKFARAFGMEPDGFYNVANHRWSSYKGWIVCP